MHLKSLNGSRLVRIIYTLVYVFLKDIQTALVTPYCVGVKTLEGVNYLV